MRRALVILLLLALLLLHWPQGGGGDEELPPLRIICEAGERFVRCPSDCRVLPDGGTDCRCQDFHYRRGDEPLRYSHTLCR